MATIALTGNDDIIFNNIPLTQFAGGTVGQLEVPNELTAYESGKNGVTVIALNTSGLQSTLTLNLLMGGTDDRRLNGLIPDLANFETSVTNDCTIVKKIGDGQGNVRYIKYILSGGMVSSIPQVNSQVDGNTEQAQAQYKVHFANTARAIM